MKQNLAGLMRTVIRLVDLMDAPDASGVAEGRIVHGKLLQVVEEHLKHTQGVTVVFAISLEGVRRTDASFPRESVMQLAHRFRQEHGFCLWYLEDSDLLENWEAAALRRAQPMISWCVSEVGYKPYLLGPELSESLRNVFEILLSEAKLPGEAVREIATADVAAKLGLSVSNASNKLKILWNEGYILRREEIAPSGGKEFRYFVAR